MENVKMTYTQALGQVLEVEEVKNNKVLFDKIGQLLVQLDKKSGKLSKSEKAKQEENERLKQVIFDTVGSDTLTIKDMQLLSVELSELSNQKISALNKKLIEDGLLERIEIKRVAHFSIPKETLEELSDKVVDTEEKEEEVK